METYKSYLELHVICFIRSRTWANLKNVQEETALKFWCNCPILLVFIRVPSPSTLQRNIYKVGGVLCKLTALLWILSDKYVLPLIEFWSHSYEFASTCKSHAFFVKLNSPKHCVDSWHTMAKYSDTCLYSTVCSAK